jgi:hypothetical protein
VSAPFFSAASAISARDRSCPIRGTVSTATNQPVADATVVLFPVDPGGLGECADRFASVSDE